MIIEPIIDTPSAIQSVRPSVKSLLQGPFTVVWIGLIVATLTSWYLGSDHGIHDHHLATAVILLVAFIKMRFVGLYFMELRDATRLLRGIFEAHCVVVCGVLVAVYLIAPLAHR